MTPDTGALRLDQRIHFFAYTDEVFAFCIGEELEQFGDGDSDAVVARTSVRVFGLVLGVLGSPQFVLVCLLFLALDGILLVDRCEEEIKRFADEGFTRCSRCGDTGEERQRLFLSVEVLEANASCQCAEDG